MTSIFISLFFKRNYTLDVKLFLSFIFISFSLYTLFFQGKSKSCWAVESVPPIRIRPWCEIRSRPDQAGICFLVWGDGKVRTCRWGKEEQFVLVRLMKEMKSLNNCSLCEFVLGLWSLNQKQFWVEMEWAVMCHLCRT